MLRWVERALFAIGIALAAWCAAILVEARFHQSAPLPKQPPLVVTQTALPGAGTQPLTASEPKTTTPVTPPGTPTSAQALTEPVAPSPTPPSKPGHPQTATTPASSATTR